MSIAEWHHNLGPLSVNHRVHALDLLGFGLSEKPRNERYSLERLALFVLDFMSAQSIERAHVVGNSMGGRIALEMRAARPQTNKIASTCCARGRRIKDVAEFPARYAAGIEELLTRPNRTSLKMVWSEAFFDHAFVWGRQDEYCPSRRPNGSPGRSLTLKCNSSTDVATCLRSSMPSVSMRCLPVTGARHLQQSA